jgi:Cu(I)/Ag(I) efflux system membrane fusion protein
VEALFVNTTGEKVSKGQAIARLYAPDLILAQKELLQVASRKELNPGLYRAAISKLRSFELTQDQIDKIESSGEVRDNITVQADYSGIVTEKHIDLGQHVMAGDPLYTLADLSRLWVVFEAYESDLSFINKGDTIEFSVAAVPGETFAGTISFIDPVVDPISQITRIRVEISNNNDIFKPEMYVKGRITSQTSGAGDEIIVPKSAVLWTGERSVVYVKTADRDNAFRVREVLLGNDLGDSYVIRSGLSAGDIVVTNGTFAVDAAAQLAGKYSMMNLPENNTPTELPGPELTNRLIPALQQYLALKNALVASDQALAKRFNQALLEEFPDPNAYENTEWHESLSTINSSAKNMANSKNIDEMRRNFINLSNEMVKWARLVPQTEGPLYIMYCPMANNNSGAVWVSMDETVENPYYGDLMLNCGEITETITQKNN